MHKVFVSFHHDNDQKYKDWTSQQIREYIRDEHLKDTSVTILLVGTETKNRKHIDWELFSSMYDGKKNKKSGILVINLPSVDCKYHTLCSQEEKTAVLPDVKNWITITDRTEFERRYPYMPARIIDNLVKPGVNISVVNWSDINVKNLTLLVDKAYDSRILNDYDMSRPMKMKNG